MGESVQQRLASLDVYRGATMLFMASEIMRISRVAEAYPGNPFWQFVSFNTSHVAWAGWSLWDLIQPSFMFMVGVALPWSIASKNSPGMAVTSERIRSDPPTSNAPPSYRATLPSPREIFLPETDSHPCALKSWSLWPASRCR